MFLKRNVYYRKIGRQVSLFDDPIEEALPTTEILCIHKKIKIPFEDLEFRYGSISFKYFIVEINKEVEFDIENLEIRPEFEVLKPYFSKVLKLKRVSIEIRAEFEGGVVVSQMASSIDIQTINREIIEGVKFKFVANNYIENQRKYSGLTDIEQLQANEEQKLYSSGEDLLNDIIGNKDFKHKKHLQYLAAKHARVIMKIRFILSPFSFVFLLAGEVHYHIIMETLDTEEATYIWHFDIDKPKIPAYLNQVNMDLQVIRDKGRQLFLGNAPSNFSRVVHDYADERKGFVIWKDLLDERLT